ncbi:MAG TPA: hypothetical protein VGM17_12695 [Rhizomicrobium sp.]
MDILFVTGMSRSGTSAITRVLSLCGAGLPEGLLRPGSANPRGYWEPKDALKANDRYLGALGTAYHDPGLGFATEIGVKSKARGKHTSQVNAFLNRLPDCAVAVVKDPRLSGLIPPWVTAARRLGYCPKIVHIFRNPKDVAASLAGRYDMPREHAYAEWLKYNLLPERNTRDLPRVFLSYAELLNDWRRIVRRCNTALGLDLKFDAGVAREVEEFLSPDLQHHATAVFDESDDPSPSAWMARVYRVLQQAATSGTIDIAEMDRVYAQYAAADRLFGGAYRSYAKSFAADVAREAAASEPADEERPALDVAVE